MSLSRGRLIFPEDGSNVWQLRSEMPFLISARLKRLSREEGVEVSRVRTRGHKEFEQVGCRSRGLITV